MWRRWLQATCPAALPPYGPNIGQLNLRVARSHLQMHYLLLIYSLGFLISLFHNTVELEIN